MSNQPGLTLADLAAMTEDVPFGSSFITVKGISASDALTIFKRFPELAKMVSGFKAADLIGAMPDAVAAIISAGVGALGDAEQEANAGKIAIETQFDLIEVIGRLTFKSGFAPFVQRIMALANVANSASFTKVGDMNSPPTSKPSSPPATPQT